MSKKPKELLSYKINSILTTNFTCTEKEESEVDELFEREVVTVNMETMIHFNAAHSIISLDVSTSLQDDSRDEVLVSHNGRTSFDVRELADFAARTAGHYNLPGAFLKQLYELAYAHARALLAVELAPTVYKNKYHLPVVDAEILVPRSNPDL